METAKVFEDGESQVVRLPEGFRFNSEEVMISKAGDIVLLIPRDGDWNSFMTAVDMFTADFMSEGRTSQHEQKRLWE